MISDWHNLDLNEQIQPLLTTENSSEFAQQVQRQRQLQLQLRSITAQAQLEETQISCQLIADIILPQNTAKTGLVAAQSLWLRNRKSVLAPWLKISFLKLPMAAS